MRLIDADALERDGWYLQRTYRKDKETMVYEVKAISEIQTVQSERKTGKWISQDYNQHHGNISTTVYYYPKCSVCGCSGDYTDAFCKSCGADMKGIENLPSAQPELEELLVICDNCGHAIHVKRQKGEEG